MRVLQAQPVLQAILAQQDQPEQIQLLPVQLDLQVLLDLPVLQARLVLLAALDLPAPQVLLAQVDLLDLRERRQRLLAPLVLLVQRELVALALPDLRALLVVAAVYLQENQLPWQ